MAACHAPEVNTGEATSLHRFEYLRPDQVIVHSIGLTCAAGGHERSPPRGDPEHFEPDKLLFAHPGGLVGEPSNPNPLVLWCGGRGISGANLRIGCGRPHEWGCPNEAAGWRM